MYPRLLLLLLSVSYYVSFSQNESFKFGDISVADLKMTTYEKDTSAAAVILFNKGTISVDINSTAGTIFTKHSRIKILRNSAFNEWGNFKILIQKNGLKRFKAITYNLTNGNIDKSEINSDNFFRNKHDKYTEEITVAFPNVKEGSIIEFEYACMYDNAYYPKWQFQYTIPVVRSEFVYTGPASINQLLSGPMQPKSHVTKHNGSRHEWVMVDIPAFKSEPHMPNKEAYLSGLKVDRARTWQDVYVELMQRATVGKILSQDSYLNGKVKELTAGMTQPLQKIEVLSAYVKESVTWNGECDFSAYDPHTVVEKGSGSSGDINLLYASLLKKAGFKVGLVFLSTRENGYVMQEFPSPSQFDYVICHISLENGELLLDATEKKLPYDMLPPRCFNHNGFLTSLEHHGWIGVEPAKREKISLNAKIVLSADGKVSGNVGLTHDGYAAFTSRAKLDSSEVAYKRNSFINKSATVKKSEIINAKEIDKPLVENYEISMDDYATLSGDLIYFNPFLFLREESNPFTPAERQYPIDFSAIVDKVAVYNIVIPEGYDIEELPQSKVFSLPENAAKCTFNLSVNNNTIVVMTRLQINKTLFYQDEYHNLREFYSRVVAKNSENVVLKKKG